MRAYVLVARPNAVVVRLHVRTRPIFRNDRALERAGADVRALDDVIIASRCG